MSDDTAPEVVRIASLPGGEEGKVSRRRLEQRPARGLLAWSIIALVLSPFSIPTFGIGLALGIGLIVVAAVFQRRGFDARGHLAAGIVAVTMGFASAGACGWLFLRPAAVTGTEAVRQNRVEARFDRFFDTATDAPADTGADAGVNARDAGVDAVADSPATATTPADGGTGEPK